LGDDGGHMSPGPHFLRLSSSSNFQSGWVTNCETHSNRRSRNTQNLKPKLQRYEKTNCTDRTSTVWL